MLPLAEDLQGISNHDDWLYSSLLSCLFHLKNLDSFDSVKDIRSTAVKGTLHATEYVNCDGMPISVGLYNIDVSELIS